MGGALLLVVDAHLRWASAAGLGRHLSILGHVYLKHIYVCEYVYAFMYVHIHICICMRTYTCLFILTFFMWVHARQCLLQLFN